MSTQSLLQLLKQARQALFDSQCQEPGLLEAIDRELLQPQGLTIALAKGKARTKGHEFELELPSGTHLTLARSEKAISALVEILQNYEKARPLTTQRETQGEYFAKLGVGTPAAPIQDVVDKALALGISIAKFNEKGQRTLSLYDLDLEDKANG